MSSIRFYHGDGHYSRSYAAGDKCYAVVYNRLTGYITVYIRREDTTFMYDGVDHPAVPIAEAIMYLRDVSYYLTSNAMNDSLRTAAIVAGARNAIMLPNGMCRAAFDDFQVLATMFEVTVLPARASIGGDV